MNIYALSSGKGPSGIAIIRISGPDVYNICKQITKLKEIKSNELNFCKFYNPKNDNVIDPEALLLWFPSPNSYTGEDLAELQIHGSNAVISALKLKEQNFDALTAVQKAKATKALKHNEFDVKAMKVLFDLIKEQDASCFQKSIVKLFGESE